MDYRRKQTQDLLRRTDSRISKSVHEYTPTGRRNVARPRTRWWQHHHGRQKKPGMGYTLLLMMDQYGIYMFWSFRGYKIRWSPLTQTAGSMCTDLPRFQGLTLPPISRVLLAQIIRRFRTDCPLSPSSGCYLYRSSDVSGRLFPSSGCYLYRSSDVSGNDCLPLQGNTCTDPTFQELTVPLFRVLLVQIRRFGDWLSPSSGCYLYRPSDFTGSDSVPEVHAEAAVYPRRLYLIWNLVLQLHTALICILQLLWLFTSSPLANN